ncbi:MAG: dienelactone hydrolase family protein [Anaerolineales bacterium]|jgi:predicted peptidase
MHQIANTPGIHEQYLPPNRRRYSISLPPEYNPSKSWPMVLALHWGGPVVPFTGKWLLVGLIQPALHALDAILVAPDRSLDDWANPQSETETLDLLRFTMANYNIDSQKILLCGYSLGGIGTWYIAARNQSLFTAALPISAAPLPSSAETEWRIPLYVIHSRQDEIFPLDTVEEVVRTLQAKGTSIELLVVDGVTHFETESFVHPLQTAIPWIRKLWT